MRLSTIGCTKEKAREFFGLLSASGATALVDMRLRHRSQLAGFSDMHHRRESILLASTRQCSLG